MKEHHNYNGNEGTGDFTADTGIIASQQGIVDNEPISLNSEVDRICSLQSIADDDGKACLRLCSPESCCFAPDEAFNCAKDQVAICKQFEACINLYGNNESSQKETEDVQSVMLESELKRICSAEGIEEDGGEACQKICSPQSCCFATEALFNCQIENPDTCKEFTLCGYYYSIQKYAKNQSNQSSSEPEVTLKTQVSAACSKNYYMKDPNNCDTLCEDAKCCFTDDVAESCRGLSTFCGKYAPCSIVFGDSQSDTTNVITMEAAKPEILLACETNYALDERNCELLCIPAVCCFSDHAASSCRGMSSFCAGYSPCQILFGT